MARPNLNTSRYQREQRFTTIAWVALALIGASVAGCYTWLNALSSSPGPAEAPPVAPTMSMQTWLGQSQPSINGLVDARNGIAAAASRGDLTATGRACSTATTAVASLRSHMPSPEAAVNQPLQQAISNYAAGLPDCADASRVVDGERFARAATDIHRGDTAMQTALHILDRESDPAQGALGVLIV